MEVYKKGAGKLLHTDASRKENYLQSVAPMNAICAFGNATCDVTSNGKIILQPRGCPCYFFKVILALVRLFSTKYSI